MADAPCKMRGRSIVVGVEVVSLNRMLRPLIQIKTAKQRDYTADACRVERIS